MASHNGNTDCRCIDCGALPVVTIVQETRVVGKLRQWHVCGRCYFRRAGEQQAVAR